MCLVRSNEYKNNKKIYIDMYIVLFSIVISAVILGAYQYIDSINRDSNAEPYDISRDLFTVNNIMAYMLIASSVFFVMYMAFNDDSDIFSSLGIMENDIDNRYEIKKINVNPSVLRNTTDPMKMGFEPYNSGGEGNASGSETCSVSSAASAASATSSDCSVDSE
jgi:hypothetical protein